VPAVPVISSAPRRALAALASVGVLVLAFDHAVALPLAGDADGSLPPLVEAAAGHLVVSEVMTGAASASDEFIELYNPSDAALPLEGLEVVYVTATGGTITRKAAWSAGASAVLPGAHLLIANSAGIFAGLADVAYTNGLASTGGSVALRIVGAATSVDAVGWGNATSTWLETRPASAPAAGSSLERLPGGSSGSGQDTDDNLIDFVAQPAPDPQNSGSPPVPGPSASPLPTGSPDLSPTQAPTASPTVEPTLTASPDPSESATETATPSATATPVPTASPSPVGTPTAAPSATAMPSPTAPPAAISVAEARSLPDGSVVTVEGVALTSGDFTDGGGYLADASAGIAVLLSDGSFERGRVLRVTGTLDDRYAQRTIRSSAAMVLVLGGGSEPLAVDASTGSIGEGVEGTLVEVTGIISSSATTLSTGVAWDLDDGSGAIRVLVEIATGIDTSSWARGVGLTLVGVVGQRDSSGSGTSGFRVQPRDSADILAVEPIATPTPTPTPEPTATTDPTASSSPPAQASPTPEPSAPLVTISEARSAPAGTHLRIRGVVTAQSGLLETGSAIVQDATAGILIRLGTDVGSLALGQYVELDGTRATKAGMLSLRVTATPIQLGTQAEPDALRRATGALGEADEARLVIVRGAVSTAVSRARGGNVSFALDDGSGPIRVTISSRAGIDGGAIAKGAWLELRAVLGQETTGAAPRSGYRLWPRTSADLRIIAAPVGGVAATATCCATLSQATAHMPIGGVLEDAVTDATGSSAPGIAPALSRPIPTGAPKPVVTATTEEGLPVPGSPAGGLVVSGMGLAALAGLAAWFGRRSDPEGDLPHEEAAAEAGLSTSPEGVPRLSVLRVEGRDERKGRRILPPT
jgi:hypothetical protein